MPFVSSSIYYKAIGLIQKQGFKNEILEKHSRRQEIIKKDKYIPIELLYEAYEFADAHLKPGFAIQQGGQLEIDDYGTLGLSWKTCWKARNILDRVQRFMILVTDEGSMSIIEEDGITRLILHRDAFRRGLEMANETTFVMLNKVMNEVTASHIYPVSVCFRHHSSQVKVFEDYFRCPVNFNAAQNSIEFKTQDINIPTLKADESIHRFLLERMEEEKKGIHKQADRLMSDVHRLIVEALPGGIPSIIQIADIIAISPRTLKRRLAENGTGFREYVQKVQKEISIQLLRSTSQSVGEITFQTGFSDQSAFNRAFKRWTSQSPIDYRNSL